MNIIDDPNAPPPYVSQSIIDIINKAMPKTILDAPCGTGWIKANLDIEEVEIDGIDLYGSKPPGYREFRKIDLNLGLPSNLPKYDCIVSCEGIEHFGNPLIFLKTAKELLNDKGAILISTPNIWYPQAKLQFLLRGFFPSFPCLVEKIQNGAHMHIMRWSFSQLYLFLKLAGFRNIQLHNINTKKPKHFYEKLLGIPNGLYCRSKLNKALTHEEKHFWEQAGSNQSIYGRHLIVSANS